MNQRRKQKSYSGKNTGLESGVQLSSSCTAATAELRTWPSL